MLALVLGSVQTIIIWLVPRASKMNQIARCDWLPERTRWSPLARSGLPAVSRKQNFPKSHIINSLLTKFVRSRWLDIGLVLFCEFMDLDFVLVHKHAKKELGQYPAILTPHLVNNPYILLIEQEVIPLSLLYSSLTFFLPTSFLTSESRGNFKGVLNQ